MVDNNIEIPVLVTYYTNSRILFTKEFGSFAHFGSVLNYLNNYIKRKGQTKLKKKYVLNNKQIGDNDLLINIIQSINKNKKIIEANLSIEIDEKIINISDNNFTWFSKILQPKLKPFEIIVFNPKDSSINVKKFSDTVLKEYELDKINENSAYCNSTKDLYISGGIKNDDLSYFWIINNEFFSIKKIKMKIEKLNHSMIYINHNNDEFIFIAGGYDLKTFYYDIKFNSFVNWGNMNYSHICPALIYINDYLYCFDTSPKKGIIFERTNLNQSNLKWEKIKPDFKNGKASYFTNFGFAANYCRDGKIMICGGDSVNINTYLYDLEKNLMSENDKCEDILFAFNEKNFYRIDINNSIALPYSLDEEKEILHINNFNYSLDKIILQNNKKKKEEEKKKNKYKIDYNKYLKNLSIGNLNIEVKTEDMQEQNINKEKDNQIESNVDTDNLDNISYFEKKSESKSKAIKNEINKNMNDIKSVYMPNNDNYKNYKKEKKLNLDNLTKYNPKDKFDDFDNDDSNINNEIKLNFNDNDNLYEAEGNNFVYDSNSCKFNDIKANKGIFIVNFINKKNDNKLNINEIHNDIPFNIINNKKNENLNNINKTKQKIEYYNDYITIENKYLNNKKNKILDNINVDAKIYLNKNYNIIPLEKKDEILIKNKKIDDIQNEENKLENYDSHKYNEEDKKQNFKKYKEEELNEEKDKTKKILNKKGEIKLIGIDNNVNNSSEDGAFIEDESINNNEQNENEEKEEFDEKEYFNENENNEDEDEEGKDLNEINKEQIDNIENNNEDGFQDRDRFQQTIIDPIEKDIIQIEHYPLLFYYNENNFCDYFYKSEEINF